jgi:uncharacterized membrane protein YgcG
MKRIVIAAAVVAAVALPAVIGLWGNASFSQAVPVRAPASGQVVAPSPSLTPTPSPSPSSTAGTIDDHGGDVPRDQRVEPGDDRGGSESSGSGSSGSGSSGSGSSGSGSSGSGSSGSGSSGDDSADDHGGHGSDD